MNSDALLNFIDLQCIKGCLKFKKYGLTQETIKNSRLVREGRTTSEEAMVRVALEQTTELAIFDGILRELGVPKDEVNWQAIIPMVQSRARECRRYQASTRNW